MEKNPAREVLVPTLSHGFSLQSHGGHKVREQTRVKTKAANGGGRRPVFTRVWARGTISSRRSMALDLRLIPHGTPYGNPRQFHLLRRGAKKFDGPWRVAGSFTEWVAVLISRRAADGPADDI